MRGSYRILSSTHKQLAQAAVIELSLSRRLAMVAIGYIPLLHLSGTLSLVALPLAGFAPMWLIALSPAALYLIPPLVVRVTLLFWPLTDGRYALSDPQFLRWWFTAQWQVLFNRLPMFEELLRIVPALYSLWLRMWGAMLLVVLSGGVVGGRITRPSQALRDAALRVAAGNLQVKVPPSTRDELGVLTLSFNEMVDNLNQAKQDQLDTYNRTIEGWSRALDLRDHETEGHSQRVTAMTVELAQQMGIAGEELEHVRRGALLHDIGKIAIPDDVLLKPGKLTKAERDLINRHPEYAKSLLEQVEFLEPALDIPFSHHEWWDGSGYPQGLKGEEIPLAARVFTVVDVWDALTSDRPYRGAMTHEEALEIIQAGKGSHFDPEIVEEFIELIERDRERGSTQV